MWSIVAVMFVIGLASALAVKERWVALVPTALFAGYFGISALDGTALYDFLVLGSSLLVPSLAGVSAGLWLSRGSRLIGGTRSSMEVRSGA